MKDDSVKEIVGTNVFVLWSEFGSFNRELEQKIFLNTSQSRAFWIKYQINKKQMKNTKEFSTFYTKNEKMALKSCRKREKQE
jgi:hypothetical protein